MNNQRFQVWRLRFGLWIARQRLRWQAPLDRWRVPVVITNRWFVLGAYFLVVLLLSIAWFARPFSFWQAGPPGDSQPPASVFRQPSDDIAPPVLPTYPESQASQLEPPHPAQPQEPQEGSGGGVIVNEDDDLDLHDEQGAGETKSTTQDEPDDEQPTTSPPKRPATQDQLESAAFAPVISGSSIELQYPLAGEISISNPFAQISRQTTLNDWRPHLAVDFAAAPGTKVIAAADGKVKNVFQEDVLWGSGVVLEHRDGCTTAYMDLDELKVETGDQVKAGQELGVLKGSPPVEQLDACHLHFVLTIDGEDVDPSGLFR